MGGKHWEDGSFRDRGSEEERASECQKSQIRGENKLQGALWSGIPMYGICLKFLLILVKFMSWSPELQDVLSCATSVCIRMFKRGSKCIFNEYF